jgi:hypothetical protein
VDLGSTFQEGTSCATDASLGACIFDDGEAQIVATVVDTDESKCGSNKFGCEVFANGYWDASAICDGNEEIAVLEDPFPQPELVCSDPLPGEPEGQSEDGQVCTWNIVSGVTEEGRRYSDYVSCDNVIRQRGYAPVPPGPHAADEDARMDDPTYVADVDWVRGQIESGSCACCHSASSGRAGAVFDTNAPGNLMNQFNDTGLAMGAGWVSTVGFGTYEPEDNNGFWRSSPEYPNLSIVPTTDPLRMMAVFARELEHRGLTRDDFVDVKYGAGPLDEQLAYRPAQCSDAEGVAADGTIRWLPGLARYVYVMEAGALSPTVPPNLDLPVGTLWRIDVPMDGTPVPSKSVTYGELPDGMTQAWPATGAPPALVPGKQYYLYASADILYPISRCLFTAGEPDPSEESGGCSTSGGGAGTASVLVSLAAAAFAGRRRR